MKKFLAVVAIVLIPAAAAALDVTVAWDANNPNEQVLGYGIFVGETEDTLQWYVDVPNADDEDPAAGTVQKTVTGLPNANRYMAATAWRGAIRGQTGFQESGFSNIILVTPVLPPLTPPGNMRIIKRIYSLLNKVEGHQLSMLLETVQMRKLLAKLERNLEKQQREEVGNLRVIEK